MLSEKETYELFKERVPRRVIDLFLDIGAGICYAQKQSDSLDGSYDLSRVKHYEPKTILPELIQCCLTESNYGESYKWKHDNEFRTDGIDFRVMDYNINTGEYCLVIMGGEEVKMTKRCLIEWWESRDEIRLQRGLF